MFPLQGQGDRVNSHRVRPLQITVGILKEALAKTTILNIAQASGNNKAAPKVHMHIRHAGYHDQSPLKIVGNFVLVVRVAFKPPAFVGKADHVRFHGGHVVQVVFKPEGEQGRRERP